MAVTYSVSSVMAKNGAAAAEFTVKRTGTTRELNAISSVDFQTADVSAKAGTDYVATSGSLSFGGDFVVPRPQDGNLNRNYPSNWVPESQQYGSGEHPMSEPEIAGIVRWILDHPNIAGIQSYHTHSGVILRPWLTFPDSHFLGDDKYIYESLGKMGIEETGYPMISVYEDFTPDKNLKRFGSSIDWTFGALGIPTFSTWTVLAKCPAP